MVSQIDLVVSEFWNWIVAEMVTGNMLFAGIGGDPKQADKEQLREIFRFFFSFL